MFLALAASTLLASCGPSTSPLTLELRTADTHAPIPGAAIEANSLALGPSLQVGDIIDDLTGRRVAFSSRAITSDRGTATLEAIPDRAVRITILVCGHAPVTQLVNNAFPASPEWLCADPLPQVQFRLGTGSNTAEVAK